MPLPNRCRRKGRRETRFSQHSLITCCVQTCVTAVIGLCWASLGGSTTSQSLLGSSFVGPSLGYLSGLAEPAVRISSSPSGDTGSTMYFGNINELHDDSMNEQSIPYGKDPRGLPSPDDIWLESDHLLDPVSDADDPPTTPSGKSSSKEPRSRPRTPDDQQRYQRGADDIGSDTSLHGPEHKLSFDHLTLNDDLAPANPRPLGRGVLNIDSAERSDEWPDHATEADLEQGFAEFEILSLVSDVDEPELPDFEADAFQSPWSQDEGDAANLEFIARTKAAHIVPRLAITGSEERDVALELLTDFFYRNPYPSTFQALRNATTSALSLELLQAMIGLRDVIGERTEFWVGRFGPRRRISVLRPGPTAFSWVLMRGVCTYQSDFPIDMMVTDDWLGEWCKLLPGDTGYMAYLSFPAYIHDQIQNQVAQALHDGLLMLTTEDDVWTLREGRSGISGLDLGVPQI